MTRTFTLHNHKVIKCTQLPAARDPLLCETIIAAVSLAIMVMVWLALYVAI